MLDAGAVYPSHLCLPTQSLHCDNRGFQSCRYVWTSTGGDPAYLGAAGIELTI